MIDDTHGTFHLKQKKQRRISYPIKVRTILWNAHVKLKEGCEIKWQIFPTVRWFTIRVFIQKTIGLDGLISFALEIVSQAERTVCHVITWRLIFVLKPQNVGHKDKKKCNLSINAAEWPALEVIKIS